MRILNALCIGSMLTIIISSKAKKMFDLTIRCNVIYIYFFCCCCDLSLHLIQHYITSFFYNKPCNLLIILGNIRPLEFALIPLKIDR